MKNDYGLIKAFGPSIYKARIPEELLSKLNNFIDATINDEEESKKLDVGKGLVGDVKQEFKLDKKTVQESGWLKFLGDTVAQWIYKDTGNKISEFRLIESWVVRQFENDYNPIHWHSGHVSGVGYLKVPKILGQESKDGKKTYKNGKIELVHGAKMFLQRSTFSVLPEVGSFYFFPNYMMHTVYPFTDSDEERRSISFNAKIDDNIYDAYGNY